MMKPVKHRLLLFLLSAAAVLMTPISVLADDAKIPYDVRLESYSSPVELIGGSEALLWLLMLALTVIALAVLFKNARRSHLD